jgi:hypothetical protein
MANDKSLNGILYEILSEIRRDLTAKVKEVLNNEIENVRKAKGLDKLIKRKEELKKQALMIENEIKSLKKCIEEKDGYFHDKEKLSEQEIEILNSTGNNLYGGISKSCVTAVIKIIKSTEVLNYLNFLKVEKNTERMFSLAVSAKEKRNVIFSLQSRDWRSLGIDLPQLPYLEKFEVENGIIKVPDKLMIGGK